MSLSTLALAELGAAATASWTRAVLVSLATALALSLIGLGAYLHYLRRRARRPQLRLVTPSARPHVPPAAARRVASPGGGARPGGGGEAVVAVAASSSSPAVGGRVACPTCRRMFDAGVRYCPYDSRRLVPASEVGERSRIASAVCPRCRRAYDAGLKFCPHDAEELIAAPLWNATRARRPDPAPTGVLAKMCPRCGERFDLSTSFCGKDGAELMTIN